MTQLVLWDGRGEKDYGSKDGLPGFTGSLAALAMSPMLLSLRAFGGA